MSTHQHNGPVACPVITTDDRGQLQMEWDSEVPQALVAREILEDFVLRSNQLDRLLAETGPETDRLVQKVYDAQQAQAKAEANNIDLWLRMEAAEDEAAAYKKLAGQLAGLLDVTDWDGQGDLCHGSVDGCMVAMPKDVDLELLRQFAAPRGG